MTECQPECIKLLGQELSDETFDVACHKFVDFLSHGTVLRRCVIHIRGSARGIVFHGATIQDCTIHAHRRFTNFSWHDVTLNNCKFRGTFHGCDFGPRPDVYPKGPHGSIIDCDFSASKLGLCRFFNCDTTSIRFPSWPTFTVLHPEENAADWLAIPFPESYAKADQQLIAEAISDYAVKGVVAATQDAREIAKKHGMSVDEIKALVTSKPYILM